MTHPAACLCPECIEEERAEFRRERCENSEDGRHHRALIGPFCKYCGEPWNRM